MNRLNCEYVREVYPDVLNGKADGAVADSVRAHIAQCEECAAEAALLAAVYADRAAAPATLHQRVLAELARPRTRRRFSRSDMAMVATLAAALIGGSVLLQMQRSEEERPVVAGAAAAPIDVGFVGVEDVMLSGDASLDDLSVEQLEKLLGEMES